MRKLVATAAAGAMLCGALSSTTALAAAKRHHHRHYAPPPSYLPDNSGCYRWGETGYHWYPFCIGPAWLYPHSRVCHQGYCWYR
jgi:hypothetical protein